MPLPTTRGWLGVLACQTRVPTPSRVRRPLVSRLPRCQGRGCPRIVGASARDVDLLLVATPVTSACTAPSVQLRDERGGHEPSNEPTNDSSCGVQDSCPRGPLFGAWLELGRYVRSHSAVRGCRRGHGRRFCSPPQLPAAIFCIHERPRIGSRRGDPLVCRVQ